MADANCRCGPSCPDCGADVLQPSEVTPPGRKGDAGLASEAFGWASLRGQKQVD